MKIFLYTITAIVIILVTFFGLGPVIFADGSMSERILTLIVVILIYLFLGWVIVKIRKYNRNIIN